jgi:ribulose-phosphate 3-epimerase
MFVPDLTFGHRVVRTLTSVVSIPVEAHLMVCNPEEQLRAAADAGASRVAFHVESTRYPSRVAKLAHALGVTAGMALNPVTDLTGLGYLRESLDFVNVLTTEPDLCSERMLPDMAARVRRVRTIFGPEIEIQVDGDVSVSTVGILTDSGAQHFVVGRALVGQPDMPATLVALSLASKRGAHRVTHDELGTQG